jgi:hypothetical protein
MHLEEGGSTIYLQKKKSSNPRTRQQFMKCNPPYSTPQASDQPSKREKWKQTKQVPSLVPMNSRQSDLLSVTQWTGVRLRGKEFGWLANYEMGKPRLGWEPGGSTIYLQKKKSSNPRTRQQFMKCNPPYSTPQASDQPIPSESTKVTPQKLNNQQTVARTTHKWKIEIKR